MSHPSAGKPSEKDTGTAKARIVSDYIDEEEKIRDYILWGLSPFSSSVPTVKMLERANLLELVDLAAYPRSFPQHEHNHDDLLDVCMKPALSTELEINEFKNLYESLSRQENQKRRFCRQCPSCQAVVKQFTELDHIVCKNSKLAHSGGCFCAFQFVDAKPYEARRGDELTEQEIKLADLRRKYLATLAEQLQEMDDIPTEQIVKITRTLEEGGCVGAVEADKIVHFVYDSDIHKACSICSGELKGAYVKCVHCHHFEVCLKCSIRMPSVSTQKIVDKETEGISNAYHVFTVVVS